MTPEHPIITEFRPDFLSAGLKAITDLPFILFHKYPTTRPKIDNPNVIAIMRQRVLEIERWAPRRTIGETQIPYVTEQKGDGDSCLWGGLLACVGHKTGTATVKFSYSGGRFWRSPNRVNQDSENSFSRDQLMGLLAYASNDYNFYSEYIVPYMQWLQHNKWKMCDSTDGRGSLRGTTKAMLYRLNKFYGTGVMPKRWVFWTWTDNFIRYINAHINKAGYRLHLIALSIFIDTHLKGKAPSKLQRATIHQLVKRQPANPFYRWLHEGCTPTTLETVDNFISVYEPKGDKSTWTLQVDVFNNEWEDSMGWEWIFLLKVFLLEQFQLNVAAR